MSSELFVVLILPWVNCCATVSSLDPMPICAAPAPDRAAANTSPNCACDCLNPTVFALATLLPITSRSLEAEFNPLNPCVKLMTFSLKSHDLFDVGQGKPAQLAYSYGGALRPGGDGIHRAERQGRGVRCSARQGRIHGERIGAIGSGGAGIRLAVPGKRQDTGF